MAATPPVLEALAGRFDGSAFDAPTGRARLRLCVEEAGEWDFVIRRGSKRLEAADRNERPDARLAADRATWRAWRGDLRGGMDAFRGGRLQIRDDLHLGVGFLAATSGSTRAGAGSCSPACARAMGDIAVARAGDPEAEHVVMLHGLGGDQGLLPPHRRGAGRPLPRHRDRPAGLRRLGQAARARPTTRTSSPARSCGVAWTRCGIERAHLIGNRMGGRVALEVGFRNPARVGRLVAADAVAGVAARPAAGRRCVKALRPELGLLQIAPRPVDRGGRAPLRARRARRLGGGRRRRVPARVPAAARPRGVLRRAAQHLPRRARGRRRLLDPAARAGARVAVRLGPQGPARPDRVRPPRARGAARGAQHVELDCGHVPQLEAPRETHAAIRRFLRAG